MISYNISNYPAKTNFIVNTVSICTYELLSKECTILNDKNINEIEVIDKISNSEYLIITKDNEEFWESTKSDNIMVDDYYGQIYSISISEDKLYFNRIDD